MMCPPVTHCPIRTWVPVTMYLPVLGVHDMYVLQCTIFYGKFPIWVILGGVVFQCGSWISNYSNVGRFGYIRRLHCLTIPIWPFLRPQRLNALHTAYRTTLSMDCHSICDSPITQYSHRRTTSTISRCSTGTSYYGCVRYGNDTVPYRTVTT